MLVHPGIHISTFLLCAWLSCEAHAQGDTAESITEIAHSAPATSEKSFVAYPAQFPQDSSLYISRHPAKIIPKRVLPITPDMGGEVEVIHRTEGKVKKGTLLVRINPDELALDEQELQQQIERNNLTAETEILQLLRQKEELQFISKLPPQRRVYVEQHVKADVDDRAISLLERKIAACRNSAQLSNQRLQKIFDKKRSLREIRMPFDGRIQYHLTIPEDDGLALVSSNAPIVTIADDSILYIVVSITDPALSRLDAKRLSVLLDIGNARTLTAPWSHGKIQKGDRGEGLVYYFTIPADMHNRAWPLVGANLVVHLHYQAEEGAIYESKANLALEAGTERYESWEELLQALRPGYAIAFNGETHICLIPKERE